MSELKRAVGLTALTFYGVGLIVGAGIYSVIGSAAAEAGALLWLSFLLSAAAAFLTALSYAELATTFPRAGAEYVYLSHAAPRQPVVAFLVGVLMIVGATATATTVAIAFAGYLRALVPLPVTLAAGLLLVVVTAVSTVGIQLSSWVNVAFTLIEVAGLGLVIALGIGDATPPRLPASGESAGVIAGAALIFFVYLGFEHVANLAEEVKDPARQLPKAILASLGITTVLYLLVAFAVLALLPPAALAATDSPLADAVAVRSPGMARVVAVIALFATSNTALITLIGGSRLMYGMARNGDLPPALGRVLGERGTPWVASLAALGLALVWLPLGGVAATASLTSLVSLTAFVSVNLALIALRFRQPDRPRPFRVPLCLGRLPLLPVAALLICLLLLTRFERVVYLAGGAVVSGALILWRLRPPGLPRGEATSRGVSSSRPSV